MSILAFISNVFVNASPVLSWLGSHLCVVFFPVLPDFVLGWPVLELGHVTVSHAVLPLQRQQLHQEQFCGLNNM